MSLPLSSPQHTTHLINSCKSSAAEVSRVFPLTSLVDPGYTCPFKLCTLYSKQEPSNTTNKVPAVILWNAKASYSENIGDMEGRSHSFKTKHKRNKLPPLCVPFCWAWTWTWTWIGLGRTSYSAIMVAHYFRVMYAVSMPTQQRRILGSLPASQLCATSLKRKNKSP